jgi:hypothetical protein
MIHRLGQGHHDLPIPSGLTAHLLVIQAHLPRGCFQGLFDRLVGANRPKDHVVRQFCLLAENAPHQELTTPALASLPGTQVLPFPREIAAATSETRRCRRLALVARRSIACASLPAWSPS